MQLGRDRFQQSRPERDQLLGETRFTPYRPPARGGKGAAAPSPHAGRAGEGCECSSAVTAFNSRARNFPARGGV